MQNNVLRDQRIASSVTDLYYLKNFPHMPYHIKSCLFSLGKMNLNRQEWLQAQEVQLKLELEEEFKEEEASCEPE